MSAVGRVVMFWVRLYTRGVPAVARDSRRAEIRSDLWEHEHLNTVHSVRPTHTSAAVLARLLAGLASDISWRHQQRHTLHTPPFRGVLMTPHRAWPFTRAIILLQSVYIAVFGFLAVVGWDESLDVAVFLLAVSAASLTGLGVRSRYPATGVSLICFSSFTIMVAAWWSPMLLLGALVITMTLITTPWGQIEGSGWSADDALQRLRAGPIPEPIRRESLPIVSPDRRTGSSV